MNWNDRRGFGFVLPAKGGEKIFLHARAFSAGESRPLGSEKITYELVVDEQGRSRASNARYVACTGISRAVVSKVAVSTMAALMFLAALFAAAIQGKVPVWLPTVYALASILSIIAYGLDKSKARRGLWRTAENSLHLIDIIGGWPGALVAQQVFRHKSRKISYQIMFLLTVLANTCTLIWVLSNA